MRRRATTMPRSRHTIKATIAASQRRIAISGLVCGPWTSASAISAPQARRTTSRTLRPCRRAPAANRRPAPSMGAPWRPCTAIPMLGSCGSSEGGAVHRFLGGSLEPLGDREVGVIAATSQLARDGHVLDVRGLDLTNYRKVPIVLYQHNAAEPVGSSSRHS